LHLRNLGALLANGVSNAGVIGALAWWRPRSSAGTPAERAALRCRCGRDIATLPTPSTAVDPRASRGVFVFASAYWALLPLVAREQIAGGPELYGLLLGVIGNRAIVGAIQLRRVRALIGTDRTVLAGSLGTVLARRYTPGAYSRPCPCGKLCRRNVLGHGPGQLESFRAIGIARLGSWPRSGHLCERVLWRNDVGQRALGQIAGWLGLANAYGPRR